MIHGHVGISHRAIYTDKYNGGKVTMTIEVSAEEAKACDDIRPSGEETANLNSGSTAHLTGRDAIREATRVQLEKFRSAFGFGIM